jgi:branched-chain amino acid transport system permease protein
LTLFLQQLVNALALGGIYALIAVGYTMVYGVLKLINFAHGEIFMAGAFVGVLLIGSGWSLVPAVAAACACCALLGIAVDRVAYQPLRSAPRLAPLITAIGMSIFLQNLAMLVWGSGRRPFPELSPTYELRLKRAPPDAEPIWNALIPALETVRDRRYDDASKFLGEYRAAKRNLDEARSSAARPAELAALQNRLDEAVAKIPRIGRLERFSGGVRIVFRTGTEYGAVNSLLRDVQAHALRETEAAPASVEWEVTQLKDILKRNLIEREGFVVGWKIPIILLTTVALMVGLELLVKKTRAGRAMRAVSLDQNTAALMGVSVNNIIRLTFVIGSVMAAVGGILYGVYLGGEVVFNMGTHVGIIAFAAAVLGGIGNIRGAALGGMLLGIIMQLATGYLPRAGIEAVYGPAAAFLVLITVILVRPTGLLGSSSVERA